MLRSLHIARTGLDTQQTQLDVVSNILISRSPRSTNYPHATF